ncbi:MAG: hypothetical protein CSA50_04650 [Gammaproteobacteria bacterium]|nr:MAG: hypothetical protein CSA50_04650 [Gammaproteobacteria bacterium]
MNVKDLVNSITHDTYQNLKKSLELGKWADGNKLTPNQKRHCMDMIIMYENYHNMPEHQRTGYLGNGKDKKTPCGSESNKLAAVFESVSQKVDAGQFDDSQKRH